MSKVQVLLSPQSDTSHETFARTVRSELGPRLRELERLKLTFTQAAPPRLTLFGFERTPLALVSGWGGPEGWWRSLGPEFRARAYRVEESVPLDYERSWPDGELTPGVSLLTAFRRKRGLDDETFLSRWFGGHTPLALGMHPLYAYVRNRVLEPLDRAPELDAIVEEQFRTPGDLLFPHRMFGSPLTMLPNMVRTAIDVAGFIDRRSLRTYLAVELCVRS
jgi:pimeloyl-ACP methyl ester carboxylesterase